MAIIKFIQIKYLTNTIKCHQTPQFNPNYYLIVRYLFHEYGTAFFEQEQSIFLQQTPQHSNTALVCHICM